jgi:hypothetical protein
LRDGLLVCWGAWIFRGPLLAMALGAAGVSSAGPVLRTVAVLLAAYSAAGMALVVLERWRLPGGAPASPTEPISRTS